MSNIAVLGGSSGDEAKGAQTHRFSKDFRYVVKPSGGNNCGHTIYKNGKKYVHHLVPSIDFSYPDAIGFLSSGMVINLEALRDELLTFETDFPGVSKRIIVDPDAFLVLPKHIEEDSSETKIGSTRKGIGPAYTDKMSRNGVKVKAFIQDNAEIIVELKRMGVQFKHALSLYGEFKKDSILFEGSQGILLDLNAGTYPYVSCGDSTLAGIHAAGFGFVAPEKVYGVAKVYSTKVGNGPFPTEYVNAKGEETEECKKIRELGKEYGATTGRPRRCGALDLPALRYAKRRGGLTHLIMAKFDILDGQDKVKVCYAYDEEPVSGGDFATAKPKYTYLDGWKDSHDVSQLSTFIDLVEEISEMKVEYISCGVNPEDLIKL